MDAGRPIGPDGGRVERRVARSAIPHEEGAGERADRGDREDPADSATVWLSPAATPARISGAGASAAAVIGATTADSPSAKRQTLATPHVHASSRVVAGRSNSTATAIVAAPQAIGSLGPLRSA